MLGTNYGGPFGCILYFDGVYLDSSFLQNNFKCLQTSYDATLPSDWTSANYDDSNWNDEIYFGPSGWDSSKFWAGSNDIEYSKIWCRFHDSDTRSPTLPTYLPTESPTLIQPCPDDYIFNRNFNKCYKGYSERLSWSSAQSVCHDYGGQLVTIHSNEENNFVYSIASKSTSSWIGLSDFSHESTWKWNQISSDGVSLETDLTYSNFYPGEPNGGVNENCATIVEWSPYWNDLDCASGWPMFICESFPTLVPSPVPTYMEVLLPTPDPTTVPTTSSLQPQNYNFIKSSAPIGNWISITSSSSGKYLAAAQMGGLICTSSNYGKDWFNSSAPLASWTSITSDASGQYLAAAVGIYLNVGGTGGGIYTSSSRGESWEISTAPDSSWTAVTSDASGQYLAACTYNIVGNWNGNGHVYTSSSYGQTWSMTTLPTGSWAAGAWTSISSSSTGQYLIVGQWGGGNGPLWYSSDAGSTWNPTNSGNDYYSAVSSDASGQNFAAVSVCSYGHAGSIYTGSESGAWSKTMIGNECWYSIAGDSTNQNLIACSWDSIYISTSSGADWSQTTVITDASSKWTDVVSSSSASLVAAVDYGGGIWISTTITPTRSPTRYRYNYNPYSPTRSPRPPSSPSSPVVSPTTKRRPRTKPPTVSPTASPTVSSSSSSSSSSSKKPTTTKRRKPTTKKHYVYRTHSPSRKPTKKPKKPTVSPSV